MQENAIATFNRRMSILAMLRYPNSLTTQRIHNNLENMGEEIDERSVQRNLEILRDAGYLEVVDPTARQRKWRRPKHQKFMVVPKLSCWEVLAFRLLEQFLEPLLPVECYQSLQPRFDTARRELDQMPHGAPIKLWETKMRLIPFNPSWASPVAAEFCADERNRRRQIHAALRDGLFYSQQCVITYQQPGQQDWVDWTVHPLMYLQCTPAS